MPNRGQKREIKGKKGGGERGQKKGAKNGAKKGQKRGKKGEKIRHDQVATLYGAQTKYAM